MGETPGSHGRLPGDSSNRCRFSLLTLSSTGRRQVRMAEAISTGDNGRRKIGPSGRPKPPKATPRPYCRHILGIDSGVQSHPKATPKPHQSHTKAPPRLHQGYTKAPPRPHQSHPKATSKPGASQVLGRCARILMVFSWYSHGVFFVFSSSTFHGTSAALGVLRWLLW